jgi:hypothetical protein
VASGGQVLLAGDFYAKSALWGSAREVARGAALADLLAQCDMVVLNRGTEAHTGGRNRGYRASVRGHSKKETTTWGKAHASVLVDA